MKLNKVKQQKGGTKVKSASANAQGPYKKSTPSYQQNSDSVKVTKAMKGGKKR